MAEIKKKGFNMVVADENLDNDLVNDPSFAYFTRMRGLRSLTDAIFRLGDLQKANPRLANKEEVLAAIHKCDYERMRAISNFFYKTSGIYQRLCRYMAYMYRYDWLITPHYQDDANPEKIIKGFNEALKYLDDFGAKQFFGDVALKVVRNGCYYGYVIFKEHKIMVQELPIRYCRSRFSINGQAVVEFNMRYFDDAFSSTEERLRIL